MINKLIQKLTDKLNKKEEQLEEYKFSTEEIENLTEQNKKKLELLKTNEKKEQKPNFTSVSKKLDGLLDNNTNEEPEIKETIEEIPIETQEEKQQDSYINLTEKNQEIIMNNWNKINLNEIDKDIIEGKEILNHNYNITYGEQAARFVHNIRKKYEIVICYLIGFNNEKKGILNKTIFSNHIDDEWKNLNQYIKILEKIRNFRK